MVDPDADPTGVVGNVGDTVRGGPAKLGNLEIVHPDLFRIAFGAVFAAVILEVADQLLLFCIDRNGGLIGRQRCFDLIVDIGELGVAVGMASAFERLAIEFGDPLDGSRNY